MKTKPKRKQLTRPSIQVCLALIIVSLFSFGFTGCQQPVQQQGLTFNFISGLSYLIPGKTIKANEDYYIAFNVTNYEQHYVNGMICIDDNLADYYQGIQSDCASFVLPPRSNAQPYSTVISFNPFRYENIDTPMQATLSVDFIHSDQVSKTLAVDVEKQTGALYVVQHPLQIEISYAVYPQTNKLEIAFKLVKLDDVKLYVSNFEKQQLTFSAMLSNHFLDCTADGIRFNGQALLDFENNEKLIKCETLLYSRYQTLPLQLDLNYNVVETYTFNFMIEPK